MHRYFLVCRLHLREGDTDEPLDHHRQFKTHDIKIEEQQQQKREGPQQVCARLLKN